METKKLLGVEHISLDNKTSVIDSRCLNTNALNSFEANVAPSRKQMYTGQNGSALAVRGRTYSLISSGQEMNMAESCLSVELTDADDTAVVVAVVDSPSLGSKNPVYYIIYEALVNGKATLDAIELSSYIHTHQEFGTIMDINYIPKVGDRLSLGTKLATSPRVKDGYWMNGIELNCVDLAIPETSEDGIVLSRSAAYKCGINSPMGGMEKHEFSLGRKTFPVATYGIHGDYYKFLPEIGEEVKDGLLCVLREHNSDLSPTYMSNHSLTQSDVNDKHIYIGRDGAVVVDIQVRRDPRMEHNKNMQEFLYVGMDGQLQKYYNIHKNIHTNILNVVNKQRGNNRSLRIGKKLHVLVRNAMIFLSSFDNERSNVLKTCKPMYNKTSCDEWTVIVTVAYPIEIGVGKKFAGKGGNKSTCVTIWEDEWMPVQSNGVRADIIRDPISVLKRMNPAVPYEQAINHCGTNLLIQLRDRHTKGESLKSLGEDLKKFYWITEGNVSECILDEDGSVKESHVDNVLYSPDRDERQAFGIPIVIPADSKRKPTDIIMLLKEHFPPLKERLKFINPHTGKVEYTETKTIIGSSYYLVLEKTGNQWQGTDTSKLGIFGNPTKINSTDRRGSPARVSSVRFGEAEFRLYSAFLGSRAAEILMLMTTDQSARKERNTNILTSSDPMLIRQAVAPDAEYQGSRTIQLINNALSVYGVGMKRRRRKG